MTTCFGSRPCQYTLPVQMVGLMLENAGVPVMQVSLMLNIISSNQWVDIQPALPHSLIPVKVKGSSLVKPRFAAQRFIRRRVDDHIKTGHRNTARVPGLIRNTQNCYSPEAAHGPQSQRKPQPDLQACKPYARSIKVFTHAFFQPVKCVRRGCPGIPHSLQPQHCSPSVR